RGYRTLAVRRHPADDPALLALADQIRKQFPCDLLRFGCAHCPPPERLASVLLLANDAPDSSYFKASVHNRLVRVRNLKGWRIGICLAVVAAPGVSACPPTVNVKAALTVHHRGEPYAVDLPLDAAGVVRLLQREGDAPRDADEVFGLHPLDRSGS